MVERRRERIEKGSREKIEKREKRQKGIELMELKHQNLVFSAYRMHY